MASIIKVDTIQDQDGNNIINENANTITIGKSGDTVQVAAGATLEGAGIQWQSDIKTSAFTAVANEGYWINTTSAAVTVTLPASASVGDTIEFADYARTWQTNNVTININSLNYQGNTSPNPTLSTEGQHLKIVYSGATNGWIPTNDDPVALGTPQPYSAEYLVVAGGGAGGSDHGGGGGAGGLLTNYGGTAITLSGGQVYTATVGSGGSGTTSASTGDPGNNSVLSGSGISTVTSTGGGGGGQFNPAGGVAGLDGGSGGGGGAGNPGGAGGAGTSPQGNDGGTGGAYSLPYYSGAGGGGAGAVGDNGGAKPDGGDGSSNSITGSAVTYAGGGGGTSDGTPGDGGSGGGGASGKPGAGTPGTANTGGGGGAAQTPDNTGSGGSGVVILRVPTANYTGTTTGSPTVTVDGTDTIIKFTGSGTYTA
jgi:hypothetical protein